MCVWEIDPEKRLCGFCLYRQCKQRPRAKNRLQAGQYYVDMMRRVSGVNALEKTRKREVVWSRNMIAMQMCLDGFVQNDIAEVLGIGRPAIVHCIDSMVYALDNQQTYWREIEIWNKFREKVYSQKKENDEEVQKLVVLPHGEPGCPEGGVRRVQMGI